MNAVAIWFIAFRIDHLESVLLYTQCTTAAALPPPNTLIDQSATQESPVEASYTAGSYYADETTISMQKNHLRQGFSNSKTMQLPMIVLRKVFIGNVPSFHHLGVTLDHRLNLKFEYIVKQ